VRSLSILGATGSIGVSTLDVAAALPGKFRVAAMAAGRNVELFSAQIETFAPRLVSVEREEDAARLRALIPSFHGDILYGAEGLEACAVFPESDTVVAGLVGAVGLSSAHAALRAGKRLALANKETMVVAGELMAKTARENGAEIVPIDSEHSAIHQALRAGSLSEVRRLILTGSGGPFRSRPLESFDEIAIEDALKHPTWKMGPKITIDSATMMNKGLEIIEAHFLFRVAPSAIEVLIHPQSLIHSMVEFCDGSIVAQMSRNDMRFPILYALAYPERIANPFGELSLSGMQLEFSEVDPDRYPAIGLAREALAEGGAAPAVLNAANEVAVAAYLSGKIRFPAIVRTVAETRTAFGRHRAPESVGEAQEIDHRAREIAQELAARLSGARV